MSDIPYGYCRCGCGERTKIAKQSDTKRGRVNGQPMKFCKGHNGRIPLDVNFFSKVIIKDGCWKWSGYKDPNGYGRMGYGGKGILAHRASWIIKHGEIENGLFVCHKCDNPECTNPDHLFLGTQLDNLRDMGRKGRAGNSMAKITIDQIREIRKLLENGGLSQSKIAERFNVVQASISNIARGRTWRNIK